jgi:hypothetical protein
MPKRTREDFLSIHRLGAAIDALAPESTPWQVATRCASAMADALAAHAIVIHQHDAPRGELRSIGVHGPNAGDLLGTTTNVDDDYVATAVLTNRKPLMLRLDGSLPRFVPDRHRVLGSSRSIVAFPVKRAGGCVGIIEIVGVAEERQQNIADACDLVGQRLVAAIDAPLAAYAPQNRDEDQLDTMRPPPPPPQPDEPVSGKRPSARPSRAPATAQRSDADPRLVGAVSKREARAANATVVTFPKRAPTLLCRRMR